MGSNIVSYLDDWDNFEPVNGWDQLPPGDFHAAPMYCFDKRENHGNGYHSHIKVFKQGGYIRGGYVATLLDGEVVLYQHNARQHMDAIKHVKGLRRELRFQNTERIFNPTLEWAKPVGDYIKLNGDSE